MILVTGKTGVGKTTILEKTNFKNIIYMDNVVKNILYKRNTILYNKIKEVFGDKCVSYLKVNTKELGKIVLKDKNEMDKLNKIVTPVVYDFLWHTKSSDPLKKIIVEMGAYINLEKYYKDLFNTIILITKKTPILKNKFKYLDNKVSPIKDKAIKYDYIIRNENINISTKLFIKIVNEL